MAADPPDPDRPDNDQAIARLGLLMGKAIAGQAFEEAARLRAEIDALAGVDPASRHGSSIGRRAPGSMGLSTDQPTVRRRPGWKRPPKPDLMTRTTKSARDKPTGG